MRVKNRERERQKGLIVKVKVLIPSDETWLLTEEGPVGSLSGLAGV